MIWHCVEQELQSPDGWLAELEFGNYNLPEKGENSLAKIEYTYQQLYSIGKPMQQVFWLPVDANWFSLATQLQVRWVERLHMIFFNKIITSCYFCRSWTLFCSNVLMRHSVFLQSQKLYMDWEALLLIYLLIMQPIGNSFSTNSTSQLSMKRVLQLWWLVKLKNKHKINRWSKQQLFVIDSPWPCYADIYNKWSALYSVPRCIRFGRGRKQTGINKLEFFSCS